MIFLFSFFENPHEFNGYQICIWDGFDFWMATSNLNENADVKRYEAISDEIRSINVNFYNSLNKDQIKSNLLINNCISIRMIYSSLEEAKLKAKKMQDGHDEHLRFSSFVR